MSERLTYTERLEAGQRQRKHMRRADHAGWNASARDEEPKTLLKRSDKGRIPKLVKLKYERMAASAFAYFRGAATVMAYDLSLGPNSGILNQICGDAHVSNLGAYEGADGRLVFDINDFDESMVGPFEWDVKRMATSILLAGREAGVKEARCREAVEMMLASYREGIIGLTKMTVLSAERHQVKRLGDLPSIEQVLEIAERSTPLHSLDTLTEETKGGERIFRTKPPTLERLTGLVAQQVRDSLTTYRDSLLPERRRLLDRYRVLDVAFKVVGTGSVGLRDYVVYLEGNGEDDPLFLQVKEEVASAYAPYLGGASPAHQGQRVAEAERAMQFQSDPFLGWTTLDGRDYLVRQLNDHKAAIDITTLKSATLPEYAGLCGELLARGHARAGDCAMIAGYLGNSERFDEAILRFAVAYANQSERDWKKLVAELKH
ncbi:DUF2252 domain-containing protein [Granulicella sp. WH15]|uniref:DUF2252 domain-containing protein n=1 Tax=Granulicella sp. WH15 TaxID=2602070 RepID=UPI0013679B44|nr:DUF2252 domain-containing protein [Granulicella sp. WH15]QHN04216.1 DUF2252 domain-containing protein [Granulicella sp. WH15]